MPVIEDDDISMVVDVLKGGWLAHGPIVEEFERAFAHYVGLYPCFMVVGMLLYSSVLQLKLICIQSIIVLMMM